MIKEGAGAGGGGRMRSRRRKRRKRKTDRMKSQTRRERERDGKKKKKEKEGECKEDKRRFFVLTTELDNRKTFIWISACTKEHQKVSNKEECFMLCD